MSDILPPLEEQVTDFWTTVKALRLYPEHPNQHRWLNGLMALSTSSFQPLANRCLEALSRWGKSDG